MKSHNDVDVETKRRFSLVVNSLLKTFFGSHIYNCVIHMTDVFLCGAMRGSSVGNYPIKDGKFPNVFTSRISVKPHIETCII